MFSSEFYAKLDPSYHQALLKLETYLEEPSYKTSDAMHDFLGKYMVPQKIWNLFKCKFEYGATIRDRIDFSFFHKEKLNCTSKKYYDGEYFEEVNVHEDLLYPYINLERIMEGYESGRYSFISLKLRRRVAKMKALYLKIKAVEDDVDEWFAALMEINDHKFVCDNVEYKLVEDLTDRKLWKKYINYLKEHDFKLLLETYSKYCRFFTDDSELKEEYRQAAIKFNAPISVPWKNPFHFEVYDLEFWVKRNRTFYQITNALPKKQPLKIYCDANTVAKQKLPFRRPLIEYILDNASGEVLQKLFNTCKWFRASLPVNVCFKFKETDDKCDNDMYEGEPLKFVEQSIKSFNSSVFNSNIDELFISTIFEFRNENPNALFDLIPRLYRCTAKYVVIKNQNLSQEELQFLIGNAVDLRLYSVRDSDGQEFSLESILQLTPKIKRLDISDVEITNETFQKLIEFQCKFELIDLCNVNLDLLDPGKFAEFVTKTCTYDTIFDLNFQSTNNFDAFCEVFDKAMYTRCNMG